MAKKSKWSTLYFPAKVLNHSEQLYLERFTSEDLDLIAGCDDVRELTLRSSKMKEPLDLARLAHIQGLRKLELDRVKFTNLKALRALPHLDALIIQGNAFTDFDDLNGFHKLWGLYLWIKNLKAFPAGLDLPQLHSLFLSGTQLSDLGFASSYPSLRALHVEHNLITDLSPLTACPGLESLYVNDNPITSLAPLAGMKFKTLYTGKDHHAEKHALQLVLPEVRDVRGDEVVERSRVAELMRAKDWDQVYAITDLTLLARGFASLMHGHFDEEMVRGALAHPSPGAFDALVAKGLTPHYGDESDLMIDLLCEFGERLIPPLTQSFHEALARSTNRYQDDFFIGKMKMEHTTIACLLTGVAAPAFTDLFLAFFNERNGFSESHLSAYRVLLDVVGKTESPLLVEPIFDLLRFEKHIIDGDAVFMKRIFKAIGQLGTKADAAELASRFDVTQEARPDVVAAYEAAIKKLGKKKN